MYEILFKFLFLAIDFNILQNNIISCKNKIPKKIQVEVFIKLDHELFKKNQEKFDVIFQIAFFLNIISILQSNKVAFILEVFSNISDVSDKIRFLATKILITSEKELKIIIENKRSCKAF